MKILNFSNIILQDGEMSSSGTWIQSMFKYLNNIPDIELCNISQGKNKKIHKSTVNGIVQWSIPRKRSNSDVLPSNDIINEIIKIVDSFKPDIIHVWGVEEYWGVLTDQYFYNYKVLIEIQGFKGVCSSYYYGGLTKYQLFNTIGLMELLLPKRSVYCRKNEFKKWENIEKQIINNHKYINTQSDFVRNIIKEYKTKARVFKTGILLRDVITSAPSWLEKHSSNEEQSNMQIFTVTSPATYKGLHVTIRAFSILKEKFPELKLKIAGIGIEKIGIMNVGYVRYIVKLSKQLGVYDSIVFLGNLNAYEIVEEYYKSDVFVNSSYVETYCLAVAEALYVGVPCVVSNSSALPELAQDNYSALYYTTGDYKMCASKVEVLLNDSSLSRLLSANSRNYRKVHNEFNKITMNQYNIYKEILND